MKNVTYYNLTEQEMLDGYGSMKPLIARNPNIKTDFWFKRIFEDFLKGISSTNIPYCRFPGERFSEALSGVMEEPGMTKSADKILKIRQVKKIKKAAAAERRKNERTDSMLEKRRKKERIDSMLEKRRKKERIDRILEKRRKKERIDRILAERRKKKRTERIPKTRQIKIDDLYKKTKNAMDEARSQKYTTNKTKKAKEYAQETIKLIKEFPSLEKENSGYLRYLKSWLKRRGFRY